MIAFTGIDMANNAVRVDIDSGSSSDGQSSGRLDSRLLTRNKQSRIP